MTSSWINSKDDSNRASSDGVIYIDLTKCRQIMDVISMWIATRKDSTVFVDGYHNT